MGNRACPLKNFLFTDRSNEPMIYPGPLNKEREKAKSARVLAAQSAEIDCFFWERCQARRLARRSKDIKLPSILEIEE